MRKMVLALLLALLTPLGLRAQDLSGRPFCPNGTVSQDQMVDLIRRDQVQTRCNTTAEQMRVDLNRRLARLQPGAVVINTHDELATVIDGLERKDCVTETIGTAGGFDLSWVTNSTRQINPGVYRRSCRPGEVLLCNANLNLCLFSETCWNTLASMVSINPRGPRVTETRVVRGDTSYVQHTIRGEITHNVTGQVNLNGQVGSPARTSSKSWPERNLGWIIGGTVAAVGGYLIYDCVIDDPCFKLRVHQEVNNFNAAIIAEPGRFGFGLGFTP